MSPLPDSPQSSGSRDKRRPEYAFSDNDFDFAAESTRGSQDRELHPVALAARGYLANAAQAAEEARRAKPAPPRAPFLIGVFEFPWYPSTLQCLIPMSLLLLGGGMLAVFNATLRGAILALIFTLGYVAACCLRTVELTADGEDAIDDWPAAAAWKDWMWAFFQVLNYLVQAFLVALVLTWWTGPLYGPPALFVVFVAFPIIALASMEAESWLPASKVILQTLWTHPVLWLIFYIEAALLLLAWMGIALIGMAAGGLWFVPVSCMLIAAVALIYARLLGRLAWCLGR